MSEQRKMIGENHPLFFMGIPPFTYLHSSSTLVTRSIVIVLYLSILFIASISIADMVYRSSMPSTFFQSLFTAALVRKDRVFDRKIRKILFRRLLLLFYLGIAVSIYLNLFHVMPLCMWWFVGGSHNLVVTNILVTWLGP